jgi:hypothetical protein
MDVRITISSRTLFGGAALSGRRERSTNSPTSHVPVLEQTLDSMRVICAQVCLQAPHRPWE